MTAIDQASLVASILIRKVVRGPAGEEVLGMRGSRQEQQRTAWPVVRGDVLGLPRRPGEYSNAAAVEAVNLRRAVAGTAPAGTVLRGRSQNGLCLRSPYRSERRSQRL